MFRAVGILGARRAVVWHGAILGLALGLLGPLSPGAGAQDGAASGVSGPKAAISINFATPNRVASRGGTEVMFYGTGLDAVTEVRVGGVPATGLRHETEAPDITLLFITVPPGQAGIPVIVFDVPGEDDAVISGILAYFEGVQLDTIVPNRGPRTGNAVRSLEGEGFFPGEIANVTVGGVSVPFNVVDAGSISITPPPVAESGPVNVKVTHVDGSSGTLVYTYEGLSVLKMLPTTVPTAEATNVFLLGTGFDDGASVLVDGVPPANINVSPYGDWFSFEVGPHALGTVDVTVTNSTNESVMLSDALRFSDAAGPRITYVSPPDVEQYGQPKEFQVSGEGFSTVGTTRVLFGTEEATNVRVEEDTVGYAQEGIFVYFTVTPRQFGGHVDVTVINPDGSRNTAIGAVELAKPDDQAPPSLVLNGDNPILTPQGETYTDPGAQATDAIDGDVSSLIEVSGAVNTAIPDRYDLNYDATDTQLNRAARVSRSVYVEPLSLVTVPVPDDLPPGGLVTGRPGISVAIGDGDFQDGSTLTFDRPSVVPPLDTPDDPNFQILPTTVFEIGGLDGLSNAGVIRVTIDYPDGDQDGFVDGTMLAELNIIVLALNDDGDTITIVPDIDPVANTASFDADASILALGGDKALGGVIFVLGGVQAQIPVASVAGLAVLLIAMVVGLWVMRDRSQTV